MKKKKKTMVKDSVTDQGSNCGPLALLQELFILKYCKFHEKCLLFIVAKFQNCRIVDIV
jgi:hypothetical protein